MSGLFRLPVTATVGGREYGINTDYRDILEIFSCLEDPDAPEFIRWHTAVALFYDAPVPDRDLSEAARFLSWFIAGGQEITDRPGPKLIDWQQDAAVIASDVNRVAGQEIRALPYLHWWTFLGWFHTVGEGRLSAVVALRRKLRRGQALESWEKTFYRENRAAVDMLPRYSRQEQQERQYLEQLLQQTEGPSSDGPLGRE